MSISLLPIRISHFKRERPARKPKHSATVEVERLRSLLDGAHALIAGLQLRLNDKDHEHAAVVARIDERHHAIVTQLQNELADAERRLDIRTWAEAAAARTQELDVSALRSLGDRFTTGPVRALHQSPLANADTVPVPVVRVEPAT